MGRSHISGAAKNDDARTVGPVTGIREIHKPVSAQRKSEPLACDNNDGLKDTDGPVGLHASHGDLAPTLDDVESLDDAAQTAV
jgi:hypothetical protein